MKMFNQSPDYTPHAKELFLRIIERYGLVYVDTNSPHVEILWDIPIQNRVSVAFSLMLQNIDELCFFVDRFRGHWFPFSDFSAEFEADVGNWIEGRARIVMTRSRFVDRKRMETCTENQWRMYRRHTSFGWNRTRDEVILRNDPEFRIPSPTL